MARTMWAESSTGKYVGIAPDCMAGEGSGPDATASSATQSPSTVRLRTSSPLASNADPDLGLAIGEDPRREQCPTRAELIGQDRRERHQDPGDEIGEDDVERRLAARQGALADMDPANEPVATGVGDRGLDGDRIRVEADRRHCTELQRRDREDPRTAPDIEDASARQEAPVCQRLDAGEAQPRRRVEPCPERHARVKREDDIVRGAPVAPPRRADDERGDRSA